MWYTLGGVLLFTLVSGVWLGAALGVSGIVIMYFFGPTLSILGSIAWDSINMYAMTAFAGYVFLGAIVTESGLSAGMYDRITPLAARFPGKLLNSNIILSAMFAAILGSSSGNSAVVGSVAIPELRRRKYDEKLLLGSVATAGTLGMLIPPSGAFIFYGALTNTSIAALFAAGTIPGVIMTIGFICYIIAHGMINPGIAPAEEKPLPLKETLLSLLKVWPLFFLMLLCTGPIYVGWCTAPEGAGVGALGALIIGKIFGDLSWQKLKKAMTDTLEITAMIYFLVIGAMIMSASVTTIGAPRALVGMIGDLPWSPSIIMLLIFIFYILMGCILDGISMMLVTMPFMAPVVTSLGFDLLWFGVLFVMVSEIGMVTPPVGLNLFVVQGIAGPKTSLMDVFMGSFPFVIIAAITMVIAAIFPQTVTLLPRLIGL